MLNSVIICAMLCASMGLADNFHQPLYRYRYQTEDVMKSDSSGVPVYHFSHGGYYPEYYGGYAGGYGGFGRLGGSGYGGDYGSEIIGHDYYPSVYNHRTGGNYFDKSGFNEGNKKVNDQGFQKASGRKEEEISHGEAGYNHGKVSSKNSKGDSGYFNEEDGKRKVLEDGKMYITNQHYNQEGKNEGEKKENAFHKKGHVIKGFKTSHHKDEDKKTEEFYDEKHDEGGNYNFGGQSGSFGEKAQSAYKGGHDNGHFNVAQNKKEGHYDTHHAVDKGNAGENRFGEKKYTGSGETYGSHSGLDQHSLLGHQEANRLFKYYPHHAPFYPQH